MTRNKQTQVQIIRDSILHLISGKFKPEMGEYFSQNHDNHVDNLVGKQLQTVINNSKYSCEVCELGGLFYSAVASHNNCEIGHCDITNAQIRFAPNSVYNFLSNFFDIRLLRIAEAYFESRIFNEVGMANVLGDEIYDELEDNIELLMNLHPADCQLIINFALINAIHNDELLTADYIKFVKTNYLSYYVQKFNDGVPFESEDISDHSIIGELVNSTNEQPLQFLAQLESKLNIDSSKILYVNKNHD